MKHNHVQKLAFDATQEIRIKHRWEAIQQETDLKENAKLLEEQYEPEHFENGDTRKDWRNPNSPPLSVVCRKIVQSP